MQVDEKLRRATDSVFRSCLSAIFTACFAVFFGGLLLLLSGALEGKYCFLITIKTHFSAADKLCFLLKYNRAVDSSFRCLEKQFSSGSSLPKPHLLKQGTSLICLAFFFCNAELIHFSPLCGTPAEQVACADILRRPPGKSNMYLPFS